MATAYQLNFIIERINMKELSKIPFYYSNDQRIEWRNNHVGLSEKEIMAKNGWSVGIILIGLEAFNLWWQEDIIRIEWIGEKILIATELAYRSSNYSWTLSPKGTENMYTLSERVWRIASPDELKESGFCHSLEI